MANHPHPPPASDDGIFSARGLWTYAQIKEHTGIGRRILDRLVDEGVLRPVAAQHLRTRFFLRRDLERLFSTDAK